MRTTITLDDDLYAVARSLARERDTTLSVAINGMLRGFLAPREVGPGQSADDTGLPVVRGTRPLTSDEVYRLERDSP